MCNTEYNTELVYVFTNRFCFIFLLNSKSIVRIVNTTLRCTLFYYETNNKRSVGFFSERTAFRIGIYRSVRVCRMKFVQNGVKMEMLENVNRNWANFIQNVPSALPCCTLLNVDFLLVLHRQPRKIVFVILLIVGTGMYSLVLNNSEIF